MDVLRFTRNLFSLASYYVFGDENGRHPWNAARDYEVAKNQWLDEHTDPLFGRPLEHDGIWYFEYSRANPYENRTPNEYNVPFAFTPSGFVHVKTDEFPLLDQKLVFEWMVEGMDDIASAITGKLTSSPRSWGVTDEQAATAFRPERITKIILEESRPVAWTIVFDTDIGEGESLVGVASGEDQKVINVDLDYG